MINDRTRIIKFIKFLVIINLITIIFTYNQLTDEADHIQFIKNETNDFLILNQFHSPFYISKTVELIYDYNQYQHSKRTDVNIELIAELVERGQIKQARSATFHNIRDCNNVKYISSNGRDEYIVKIDYTESGEVIYLSLVRDGVNRGTYNLFNQEGPLLTRRLHKIDIYLWILYGTGISDTSTLRERFYFSLYKQPVGCSEEMEDT